MECNSQVKTDKGQKTNKGEGMAEEQETTDINITPQYLLYCIPAETNTACYAG